MLAVSEGQGSLCIFYLVCLFAALLRKVVRDLGEVKTALSGICTVANESFF